MVSGELIAAHEWEKIEKLTRDAVNTMLGFSVHGVGLLEQPGEKEEPIRRLERLWAGGFLQSDCDRNQLYGTGSSLFGDDASGGV